MSNPDRIRSKIQKLLRLAGSDNPHEAERAKAQAKALMAKHNTSENELEIIETKGKHIPRKKLKDYENWIISKLKEISGCEVILHHSATPTGKYQTHPTFLAPQAESEIAAYTWDVLQDQIKDYRKKHAKIGFNTAEIDTLLVGWTVSVCDKISDIFPKKETHPGARSILDKQDLPTAKTLKRKIPQQHIGLEQKGMHDGLSATLHIAASNQTKQTALLEQAR
ncbi:DUF2786 domain-containing protein [Oceanospirillum beijerinckii]|uniref:DUF2786 domain-containing protein n=1 Tax=Oceanospirillum beijerinckii TaxID=64976 RepID=UPI0004194D84|nr:DUF2786 domain-containing protein [Oceanospirillum beijerinckii]